jgi:peptidoglycan/xylan/chitin deacetylase (PgdA/CDA1 family)
MSVRLRKIIKETGYTTAALCGVSVLGRYRMRGKLLVLTYHSFCTQARRSLHHSLPIGRFEAQLRFLRKHYRLVALQEGIDALTKPEQNFDVEDAGAPMVAITVDDGFLNNYELMFPVVKKLGVPVVIFLAADFLDTGRPPWPTQVREILERTKAPRTDYPFPAQLINMPDKAQFAAQIKRLWKHLDPAERQSRVIELGRHLGVERLSAPPPLEWGQVREMQDAGVHFGSHTIFHSILPAVSKGVARQELADSKARLENELQTPCTLLAYPDGGWDLALESMVKDAGYRTAVTQERGVNGATLRPYAVKRLEVPYDERLAVFACRTAMVAL